jgi:hypothetical protein
VGKPGGLSLSPWGHGWIRSPERGHGSAFARKEKTPLKFPKGLQRGRNREEAKSRRDSSAILTDAVTPSLSVAGLDGIETLYLRKMRK